MPSHDLQFALFDLGKPVPVALQPITPGCLRTIPEKSEIDVNRAASILGTSGRFVEELAKGGDLCASQVADGGRWSLDYNCLVAFCNQLRTKYGIQDRRSSLRKPGMRWRDHELLPFPLEDTIGVHEVMVALNISRRSVLHLCEEGAFDAYRLRDLGSHPPWRISKLSLFAFAERKRKESHANCPLKKESELRVNGHERK